MKISWLLFYCLSIFLVSIIFDKSIETQILITELLKIFISGYLGYLIRQLDE